MGGLVVHDQVRILVGVLGAGYTFAEYETLLVAVPVLTLSGDFPLLVLFSSAGWKIAVLHCRIESLALRKRQGHWP